MGHVQGCLFLWMALLLDARLHFLGCLCCEFMVSFPPLLLPFKQFLCYLSKFRTRWGRSPLGWAVGEWEGDKWSPVGGRCRLQGKHHHKPLAVVFPCLNPGQTDGAVSAGTLHSPLLLAAVVHHFCRARSFTGTNWSSLPLAKKRGGCSGKKPEPLVSLMWLVLGSVKKFIFKL